MEGAATIRTPVSSNRNRKDHYIPRSFLRGFIDPSRWGLEKPLWYLDIPNIVWCERSPGEVGYRYGFYDYATAEIGLETADQAFAELEGRFPRIRRSLIEKNFENWKEHLDFLLRYAQMMRARSLLFFEDKQAEWSRARGWIVQEVLPDGKSVRVKSMTPEPLPAPFIRNRTIVEMREEVKKGAAWLKDFNWCLRYSDSPSRPFVISEIPFVCRGRSSDLKEALQDPETLLFFPLCWQACLIGSRQIFDKHIDRFGNEDMHTIQKMYRESATLFLLSPTKLDF
jgi:hypothetical protein